MKILFVTHYGGFYGANKSLLTLMLLLRERYGVQPIVLLPSMGPMCERLKEESISYKVFHYYWWVNYNRGIFQWLLNKRKQLVNLTRVGGLCNLFKDNSIDLIYSNSICVNVGFFIAKRLGVPHIWQARESLVQYSLSLSLPLSKRIWASPVNRKYLLISDYMMSYYKPILPAERMARVYNGVNLPLGTRRMKENCIGKRLQIVSVGVLCEQKNQMELLKAQAVLLKRGIEVDVWLIGTEKQDYAVKLHNYVKKEGMENLVHFVGHTDDVFELLQRMNLGVVSAHDEAFGRVTVEYMLMRMPVVVSRSGANAELIEPGITGEIYHLGDVEALADAIEDYVKHPEQLETQGEVAEQKARRDFSAEKNAELIYQQIVYVVKH